jgi:hypothetical protein
MTTVTDTELRTTCFHALVERVGYLGTERFIVMMNCSPEDYTAWREAQPDAEETIEDLGAKIMAYEASSRGAVVGV